jgi:hypothetical protein
MVMKLEKAGEQRKATHSTHKLNIACMSAVGPHPPSNIIGEQETHRHQKCTRRRQYKMHFHQFNEIHFSRGIRTLVTELAGRFVKRPLNFAPPDHTHTL